MKDVFLYTNDKAIAEALKAQGFEEVSQKGKLFCFLNNGSKFDALSDESRKKIIRTNMMLF